MKLQVVLFALVLMVGVRVARADPVASAETRGTSSVGDLVRIHLEPSTLGHPLGFAGLDRLYFETSVVPHFSLLPRHWRVALFLTPKIVLRMFREASAPVKTPSYMPRLTVFLWFQDAPDPSAPYFFLALSHHSNGQAGPFRVDGHNNHETGSFETNDAELGGALVWPENLVFSWNSVSIEYHPPFLEDSHLSGSYGDTRLHWATTIWTTKTPFVSDVSARFSAIFGEMTKPSNAGTALARLPISVRYAVHPEDIGVGFYAAYYQGQDYYNIWYDRFVSLAEVGIVGSLATGVE